MPISQATQYAEEETLSQECKELLLSLPKERGWRTPFMYKFQDFWCQAKEIQAILSFQKHFLAKNNDVFLATIPKSGTTWLKALTFTILNRKKFPPNSNSHPLFSSNPHDLVPFLEYKLYQDNEIPDLSRFPEPRIFATHVPFHSLGDSIKNNSGCKILYVCRNPFDTFVSSWLFTSKLRAENLPPIKMEDCFDDYCEGKIGFGPFWDHVLGYWKESKENPSKVMFLKYEDMKEDVVFYLKKIGDFLNCPFSDDEERNGVIEEIAKLCSFENLKEIEVNKSGKSIKNFDNKLLFRKGEVGDYMNYLSHPMVDKLAKVLEEKLRGSGLEFSVCP